MKAEDGEPPNLTQRGVRAAAERQKRQAAALRANLQRRKAQARQADEAPPAVVAETKD